MADEGQQAEAFEVVYYSKRAENLAFYLPGEEEGPRREFVKMLWVATNEDEEQKMDELIEFWNRAGSSASGSVMKLNQETGKAMKIASQFSPAAQAVAGPFSSQNMQTMQMTAKMLEQQTAMRPLDTSATPTPAEEPTETAEEPLAENEQFSPEDLKDPVMPQLNKS